MVIGNSVTTIGDYAFSWCTSLTSVIIPDSVTTIGDYAFSGCWSLTSVVIGDSVTTIGEEAFYNCNSLMSVVIGDSVTTIGDYAFSYCRSLTSVEIPDSVTSIGEEAFYNCDSLTSVVIGDSVTTIGERAFSSCDSLTNIEVGENNSVYKDIDGNLYSKDGTHLIQYAVGKTATEFTIPDSITSIGEYAFAGCSNLMSVVIGDNVTTIGEYAFYNCYSLTSVVIGNSVTTIGEYAFYNCDNLTSMVIPVNVVTIERYAFGWSGLTDIYYGGTPSEWTEIVANYYDFEGITVHYCIVLPTVGAHTWVVSGVIEQPTCETSGTLEYSCEDCSATYVEYFDSLGHDEVVYAGKEPTCTEGGWVEYVECQRAGCGYSTYEELPAAGHRVLFNEGNSFVTENDSNYPFMEEGNVIVSTNHEDNSSATYTIIATASGVLELEYVVSSESGYDTLLIAHNGVTLVTASGAEENRLSVDMLAGDALTITYSKDISVSSGEDCARVIIQGSLPEYVIATEEVIAELVSCNNSVVCACCQSVLAEMLEHNYVYHEKQTVSCTQSGWEAYRACSNCDYNEKVEIPSLPHEVENGVCSLCNNVITSEGLTLTLLSDGTYMVTDIGYCMDSIIYIGYCNGGGEVSTIASYAFYGCSNLTSVVIGDCVTVIENHAFYEAYNVIMYCEAETKPWGWGDAWNVSEVASYIYQPVVWNYTRFTYVEVDGITYALNGQEATIIKASLRDSYIPATVIYQGTTYNVVALGEASFNVAWDVKNVIIPEGVVFISACAFRNCYGLTGIVIPQSVIEIGEDAVAGFFEPLVIYYQGTESDWENISIGSYNSSLRNAARYYYSETEPTSLGNYWHYDDNGHIAIW